MRYETDESSQIKAEQGELLAEPSHGAKFLETQSGVHGDGRFVLRIRVVVDQVGFGPQEVDSSPRQLAPYAASAMFGSDQESAEEVAARPLGLIENHALVQDSVTVANDFVVEGCDKELPSWIVQVDLEAFLPVFRLAGFVRGDEGSARGNV